MTKYSVTKSDPGLPAWTVLAIRSGRVVSVEYFESKAEADSWANWA